MLKSEFERGLSLERPVLRGLSAVGLEDLAYIKPITVRGQTIYGIYAADGTPLTSTDSRDLACAIVRQHEMEPVSLH